MLLSILLAIAAIIVTVAEFFYRDKNVNDETRLSWIKIIAATVVFFIAIYKSVEPSLMKFHADKYYKSQEYGNAMAIYKKLELTDPENLELLSKIAQIYKIFSGQAESVIKNEFYEKSIEYYAKISIYNKQAIEPKLSLLSLFNTGGQIKKYTEYFRLLRAQVEMKDYLQNYDGKPVNKKQLSEVHRKLMDYLINAFEKKPLRIYALQKLGYPINDPKILLDMALEHLDKANRLNPNSKGILINDSQVSLMRSRVGNITSNKNIFYLQRAFTSSLKLLDKYPIILHRRSMPTRLLLKVMLDPRISRIDTKGVLLSDIVDKLEKRTLSIPKNDYGYLDEVSINASYLYQTYKNLGNEKKSKKWESVVINLRSYLKPKRKDFLCKNYNIVCQEGN